MKKYFYYVSFIVVFFAVALVVFFKIYVSSEVDNSCNNMKAIAADIEKINHIKSGVTPYYGTKELIGGIGKAKYLDKNFNPVLFDKLDIDWDYIGLPEYFVQIYFDGVMYNEGDFERIRVLFGRNVISINLSGTTSDNHRSDAEVRIIKVGDGVTVLCSK